MFSVYTICHQITRWLKSTFCGVCGEKKSREAESARKYKREKEGDGLGKKERKETEK